MSTGYVLTSIAIIALVTALIRFLPFAAFGEKRKIPGVIEYLGKALPCAVMGMLVVYCLKDVSFAQTGDWLPEAAAVAAVVLIHIWKKNTLLSILAGTAIYMVLI